jgi:DNA repair protein RadA/Sms
MVSGFDYGRASIAFAILEKRIGLFLGNQDIFVNIAGGVKIEEPAMDLGVCLAVASSFKNRPVPQDMVVVGEVGLAGEVRGVTHIEGRIKEAARLGFKCCLLPQSNNIRGIKDIEIKGIRKVEEALKLALA